MKNLVVIYFGDDWDFSVPISNGLTREAFQEWNRMGEQFSVSVFRASIQWYDPQKGFFTKAWAFRNEAWIHITGPIFPDFIYDKVGSKHDYELFELKKSMAAKTKVYNDPQFRAIVGNKISQYMLFGEFMPKSFIANNTHDLCSALERIRTDKAVIKPLYGSGGEGIVIDEKKNLFGFTYTFPVLVQEFIVSENGIPGFSQKKEVSDLRLVFNNHRLEYALSRIAKEGSLFTNLHQGASGVMVPKNMIPQEVWEMVVRVQERLEVFSEAQYSIDFIFDNKGKPFLIELNTTPGVDLIYVLSAREINKENFKSLIAMIPGIGEESR